MPAHKHRGLPWLRRRRASDAPRALRFQRAVEDEVRRGGLSYADLGAPDGKTAPRRATSTEGGSRSD